MKTTRIFLLLLAVAGFLFASIIHFSALWGRPFSSESWSTWSLLGALVLFVLVAYLGGARPGPRGMVPFSEIVKRCPTWLKRADYFIFVYGVLIFLWQTRVLGVHWRRVELSPIAGTAIESAFAMSFYVSSFCVLFGRPFGDNGQDTLSGDATHKTT
jgi:hypothetical protein